MTQPLRFLSVALLTFALLPALRLGAAEKLDLSRNEPVPAGQPIPIMDFFRPRLLQQPKLNPAGTHIAAIITAGEDRHQVFVSALQSKEFETAGGLGDKDVYQVDWLNDRRLIFALGTRKQYGVGLVAAEIGNLRNAYAIEQYYNSRLLAVPPKDRLHPLVWNRHDGLETGHDLGVAVLDTDVNGGKLLNLDGGTGATMEAINHIQENNERHILNRFPSPEAGICYGYLADKEGRLAFSFCSQNGVLALYHLNGHLWEKCPVDLERIHVIGCGNAPGQLVVRGPRQEGKPAAVQFMDGPTGQLGQVLVQDDAYDFDGWLYRDPGSQDVIGAIYERNGPQCIWFDESYRGLQQVLNGFFPGSVVRVLGSDDAGKIFLVSTFSDRQPAIYNWVDLSSRKAGLIKKSAPWIDPTRMQPMNVIKFKTRDGHRLDAFLTLPAGATKQNPPPLVILPHGGPWARDAWGFDGEVQFLASRGYAVLQPNYRGSPGYDWMFPMEDRWDFRKMHDDVTDAAKAMIASGLIDGGRVAIMGGSFGGYLAISGVVNEPALYRCAITIAGVFDWERQLQDEKFDQYENPSYGRMMRMLGDPKVEKDKFDRISPGRHADRIRVPVFVAGGKDDNTVEITQSKDLVAELEKYQVPHETFIVREEGHGMRHLPNEVALYTKIEAFLAKNLMPAKAATASSP